MQDQIRQLLADANSGLHSRRALLQRAAAMGLSFPAAVALFTGARPLRFALLPGLLRPIRTQL